MDKSEKVGFLYINGLGDGKTTFKDRVVKWWWGRAGLDIEHMHIDWYDGISLANKLAAVEQKITDMLRSFDAVAIIGSSAGGSLAINVFHRLSDRNVCAVSAHGRLAAGEYKEGSRKSLYRRAHLGTDRPSQAFFESVTIAETKTVPSLTEEEKKRILVLTQLTDMVVPLETMTIDGVRQHRSITLGHTGGFVAHMLADRDLISDFAQERLLRP